MTATPARQTPATPPPAPSHIRLSGQYDERLLGSLGLQGPYYNWNRWYLPGVGRYIEPDSIAFKGGFNGAFVPDWYSYTLANPLSWTDPLGLAVYRCCRDIQVNVVANALSRLLGLRHCFIKTDTKECGMGPAGGGPLPANPLGIPTQVTDHAGQSAGATCELVQADEDCVNRKCKIGRSTGPWGPRNQCNTWADAALGDCIRTGSWGGDGGGSGGGCGCRGVSGGW